MKSKVEKGDLIPDGYIFDNFVSNSLYIFNDKGNRIEENRYNSDGELLTKATYKYDDKGNIVEMHEEIGSDHSNKFAEYEYDKQGNWTRLIYYENRIPKYWIEREFEYF